MIILACILLFFIFLLTLKATITIEYNDELSLSLRILFIKINLLPNKKKKYPQSMSARKARRICKKLRKKAAKKQAKDEEKQKEKQQKDQKEKKKRSVREILDIVSLASSVVKVVIQKTFGHLRLKMTRVRVKIATGDAATTAVAYGAVSQSINVLFAILNEVKRVKLPSEDELDVSADFLADKSEIDLKLSFSLRTWHLLHIACAAIIKLVKRMIEKESKKAENQHVFPEK